MTTEFHTISDRTRALQLQWAMENFLAAIATEYGLTWTTWQAKVRFLSSGTPTLTLTGAGYVIHSVRPMPFYENFPGWQNNSKGMTVFLGEPATKIINAWKKRYLEER